ncbi:MAG: peptidoglycan DD-metalloendopeptidase family protein [Proteobacteria bacterium]|nr:peptidoglycan DD-metalloendopeptidase family protein [Pseudomonadota bacterium]
MKALVLLLSFSLLLLVTACGRHKPAPVRDVNQSKPKSSQSLSKQNKYQPKYVVVRKGDTLYSMGFSQNMDYKTLAKINGIVPPYNIYPGQKLRLKPLKTIHKNSVVTTHRVAIKKPLQTSDRTKKSNNPKANTRTNTSQNSGTAQTALNPIVLNPIVKKPVVKKPLIKSVVKSVVKKPKQQQAPVSNSRWIWPVSGRVISNFSSKDVARKGIDVSVKLGSPVYASNNGTVVYSGDGLRGYGELIIVKHSNNLLSAYAHNSSRLVKEGAVVVQGQVIAKSGKGTDGRALLHFEIRKNGQPVNPLKYLPKK